MEDRDLLITGGVILLVLLLFGGGIGFGMIFWVLLLIALIYVLTDRGKLAKEKTAGPAKNTSA